MDAKTLKSYIYENHKVQEILEEIGCHDIKFHSSGYYTAANKDGNNKSAITIYNEENLGVVNYTRTLPVPSDIITLTQFNKDLNFFQAFKFLCQFLALDVYAEPENDLPESLRITKMLLSMNGHHEIEEDIPIKPIPVNILTYYKTPCVNDIFLKDGISYQTQLEFLLGFDDETSRITIPIFDEMGNLVSVKGRRAFQDIEDDEFKYLYLYKFPRNKVLFGANKTLDFIKQEGKAFIAESEKGVMQLWSYGYKNCVATGGTKVGKIQIEKISRLGVEPILAFDQDVTQEKLAAIAEMFDERIPVYAIIDKSGILSEKESPMDNEEKWKKLISENIYRIK